jgi:hypothetical protein
MLEVLTELRKANETGLNSIFGLYLQQHELQATTRNTFTDQMKTKIQGVQWLQEKLTPSCGVGCRRLTPGDWLPGNTCEAKRRGSLRRNRAHYGEWLQVRKRQGVPC